MEENKLKGLIVAKYGNVKNFCEQFGFNYTNFTINLNTLTFTQKMIIKIVKALDIDINDIGIYFFAHLV